MKLRTRTRLIASGAVLLIAFIVPAAIQAADDTAPVTALVEVAAEHGLSVELEITPSAGVVGRRTFRFVSTLQSSESALNGLTAEIFVDRSGLSIAGPAVRSVAPLASETTRTVTWGARATEPGLYIVTVQVQGFTEAGSPVFADASETVMISPAPTRP